MSRPDMSHSEEQRLEQDLKQYLKAADVSDQQLSDLQQSVMQQLTLPASGDPNIFSWLGAAWWRPALAGALPLVFGFVIGLNSQILSNEPQPTDIAGLVYSVDTEELDIESF